LLAACCCVFPQGCPARHNSWLFDYDTQWATEPRFVHYNYEAPEEFPAELRGTFDLVVIDPPFITEDVWRQYAVTAQLLLKPDGECHGGACEHASSH
jgi:16S rRNA G966 N2-methylase RsmD